MSYQKAEEARQTILDHLHAHPFRSCTQIADETGISRNASHSCIRYMHLSGEIIKHGSGKQVRYTASAKTTITADQVVAAVRAKRVKNDEERADVKRGKAKDEPWLYRNRPDHPDHVAPTNQGGQGALRARVYVGASEAMI